MPRFQPDDFGYDFADAQKEEQEALVPPPSSTTTTVGVREVKVEESKQGETTGDYELYRETTTTPTSTTYDSFQYHPPKGYRGGEGYVASRDDSGSAVGGGAACLGATCCCLTVCLVVAGGIMLVYEQSSSTIVLVGSILLVLAAGTCLCACCVLCIGAFAAEAHLFGSSDGDGEAGDANHKEVKVRFRRLNDRYEKGCLKAQDSLNRTRLNVVANFPAAKEAAKKQAKERQEEEKKKREEFEKVVKQDLEAGMAVRDVNQKYRPTVFLVNFDGDVMVSSLELLRKQVSLVVNLGKEGDQCVVILTSPGGAVSNYGLAASQLVRIRKAGIHLVVCVDTIAASGGYMMASVANVICAAPFAIVGSIGVVTQIPNFQRFLEDKKIDAYLMTAGKHKRTIDVIGDVTEEGKTKLREELDDIHVAFKDHIAFARPKVKDNIEEIATGEHWLAVQAKELGLVDVIMTSDEYLESVSNENDIIEILEKKHKPSFWKEWNETAASVKSIAQRVQSTVEAPERSPNPMAIV